MKNKYDSGLLAQCFLNAFRAWREDPKRIVTLARIVEDYWSEFGSEYVFPQEDKTTVVGSEKKTQKTDRTKLTKDDIEQLEDYLTGVVNRLSSEPRSDEFCFLDGLLTHLEFESIDQEICRILLLSSYGAFDSVFGIFSTNKVGEKPEVLELISAFTGENERVIKARMKFDAPLLNSGIVYLMSRDFDGSWVDDRINYHLHGKILENIDNGEFDIIAAVDRLIGKPVLPETEWEDFDHIREKAEYAARILKNALENNVPGINILIYGDTGTGKTEFSKVLAAHIEVPLYAVGEVIECEEDEENQHRRSHHQSSAARLADKRLVENMLGRRATRAITMFDEMEDLLRAEEVNAGGKKHSAPQMTKSATNRLLEGNDRPCIWTTNNISRFDQSLLGRFSLAIELRIPNTEVRIRIIKRTLGRYGRELTTKAIHRLAENHIVPPAFVSRACRSADLAARNEPSKFLSDLELSLRISGQIATSNSGIRVPRPNNHYDLGLVNTDQDLKMLTARLAAGVHRNFSICAYGVSGAGKSEYLIYLAHKIGIEPMLVPYSDVGSTYVSETEQNIRMKFEEARDERRFLIFDEADSLLADRRDAQRSWERTVVNEMLTNMDSHEYPFGCITNLMRTIDTASLRRFTFKIRFEGLKPDQARKAFQIYFDHDLPINTMLPPDIAPGDFANVQKQAIILGMERDTNWLIRALQKECEAKTGIDRPLGFRQGVYSRTPEG